MVQRRSQSGRASQQIVSGRPSQISRPAATNLSATSPFPPPAAAAAAATANGSTAQRFNS